MQTLKTIQTAHKLYETQDRPILVMCNDLQEYVCKHSGGNNGVNLFCEYVAASFLKIWQLPVPEFCFITVDYEHVKGLGLPKHFFERTCFGSRYSRFYQELHYFNTRPDTKKQVGYIANRNDLLKIALFDLWMANEDRYFNNLNLMIDVQNNYLFVPIDHGAICNSKMFSNRISILSENESLITTDLVCNLFSKFEYSNDFERQLEDYFYICINKCKQQYAEICKYIPMDWDIKSVVYDKVKDEIFSEEWEQTVFQTFLTLLSSLYKF